MVPVWFSSVSRAEPSRAARTAVWLKVSQTHLSGLRAYLPGVARSVDSLLTSEGTGNQQPAADAKTAQVTLSLR